MPVIAKITTHEVDARARLLQQFKGQPRVEALLNAFVGPLQELEDYLFPLTLLLDIDTMTAAQLDGIGDILSLGRKGLADAAYRDALKARIFARLDSGTPDQIIAAYALLTGSTLASVDYDEDHPAGYVIWGDGTFPADLTTFLEAVSPAGVYCCGLDLFVTEAGESLTTEAGEGLYACHYTHGR